MMTVENFYIGGPLGDKCGIPPYPYIFGGPLPVSPLGYDRLSGVKRGVNPLYQVWS